MLAVRPAIISNLNLSEVVKACCEKSKKTPEKKNIIITIIFLNPA